MDIQDRLLALLAPVRTGDELVPGVRLVDASVEAGLRLLFDANGRRLHVEVHPAFGAPAGARWVARSARLLFRYRSGHGDREVDPGTGLAVCQAVARAVAANEDEVLAAVSADAAHARGNVHGGDLVREVRVDRLLMAAETRGPLHYTLSPYVGCLIGCRFCYAQSTIAVVRRLEGRSEAAWGSFVDVRVNAADVLARELGELAPAPIKFCPIVSDPYQAVERRYRLTRSCLEAIAAAGRRWPAMVLTRSTLVLRDLDLLSAMPDVRVGFSIPTIDDGVRAHFEPRGARIADRVSALARLREAGLRTFAVVQPLLPGPLDELSKALSCLVESVSIDVLGPVGGAADDFSGAWAFARDPAWQANAAQALARLLAERGVPVWPGELPP
jgi:DNA repair photolyase